MHDAVNEDFGECIGERWCGFARYLIQQLCNYGVLAGLLLDGEGWHVLHKGGHGIGVDGEPAIAVGIDDALGGEVNIVLIEGVGVEVGAAVVSDLPKEGAGLRDP